MESISAPRVAATEIVGQQGAPPGAEADAPPGSPLGGVIQVGRALKILGREAGRKPCLKRPSTWTFRPSTRRPCPAPRYRSAISLLTLTPTSYRLIASCPSTEATCGASALSVLFSLEWWALTGKDPKPSAGPCQDFICAAWCSLSPSAIKVSPLLGQIGRMALRPPNGVTAWPPPPICHGLESLARLFQPEQKHGL